MSARIMVSAAVDVRQRGLGRSVGRLAWWVVAAVLLCLGAGAAAYAAPNDERVESLTIAYQVDQAGVVHVVETIVYRFGAEGKRHGIVRDLLVREPFDTEQDQRYDVSAVHVSSPTGADTTLASEEIGAGDARTKVLRLRIGSADRAVADPTATYVISYDVRGALRHFEDHSEFYWDATGRRWVVPLNSVKITVEVSGGVTRAACYAGAAKVRTPCASASIEGAKASYAHGELAVAQQVTVVAAIRPNRVTNDNPILVPKAAQTTVVSPALFDVVGAVLGVVALVVVSVFLVHRRSLRLDSPSPVSTPPSITVAEARLLMYAVVDPESTTATLLELGQLGAIRIEEPEVEARPQQVVLVDPIVAVKPHHRALLKGLFPRLRPGAKCQLRRGRKANRGLLAAQRAMTRALHEDVATKGWYHRAPAMQRKDPTLGRPTRSRRRRTALGVLGLAVLAFAAGTATDRLTGRSLDGVLVVAALVVAALAVYLALRVFSRGRLTAAGGEALREAAAFRRYLAMVPACQVSEADMARFLPWALAFELGDRWEKMLAGDDPMHVWSSIGMFRLGKFRRAVAAFTAGTLGSGPASAYEGPNRGDFGSSVGGGGGTSSGFGSDAATDGGGGGGGGGAW